MSLNILKKLILIIFFIYREFSMEVRDTKPSFMDIDKNHLMNKIETEDFTPEDPCPENHMYDNFV